MGFLDDFTRKNSPSWKDPSYWRALCPSLTLSDDTDSASASKQTASSTFASDGSSARVVGEERRSRLIQDGYALVDKVGEAPESRYRELIKKLREAVTILHSKQCPATFVLVYDEAWELARIAQRILGNATHPSNVFNFDLLAWYIDPREGGTGFSPHRDRQPEDAPSSFHLPDQQAKYVTLWLALSDATPENSCLYVIPKPFDPGYTDGDDDDGNVDINGDQLLAPQIATSDPMRRALPTKESFQCIRALPRQGGQAVMFTHRILHWGSRGNPNSPQVEPRVAISFVCSDPSFEKPYLVDPKYLSDDATPPLRIRLLLVCAQLLIYYQRFDLPKECIRTCYNMCKESEDLDEAYRQKVMLEFVKAMKEFNTKESKVIVESEGAVPTGVPTSGDSECSEGEEDAMLEEMLDAEAAGYGADFEDDFDEAVDAVDTCSHDNSSDSDEEGGFSFAFDKRRNEDKVILSEENKRSRLA